MSKPRCICKVCGRNMAVRSPRGGDGSWNGPVKHKDKEGNQCMGVYYESPHEAGKAQKHHDNINREDA